MVREKGRTRSYRNNRGATMMVAIIIMAILIIFTFALMLVAYTLYASQTKNVASMRCAETANSLSAALDAELTDAKAGERSNLYKYLRYNICMDEVNWPYYNDDENGHSKEYAYRYFDIKYNGNKFNGEDERPSGVSELPGSTKVCIYWELPDGDSPIGDYSTFDRSGILLHIDTTCEIANQSYTAERIYKLKISDYNMSNSDDKSACTRLFSTQSEALNPMGYVTSKVRITEKWTWVDPNEG